MIYDLEKKTQYVDVVKTNQVKIQGLKIYGFALDRNYNTDELANQDKENEMQLSNTLGDPQFYFV